ncbi:MAG: HI0074 family nucleotidyltransferase substrate-binding subunit [bacterium]
MDKIIIKLQTYKETLASSIAFLEECLSLESSRVSVGATIKAFEIAFEVAWKTIKSYSEKKGFDNVQGSADAFRMGLKLGLYDEADSEILLSAIEQRNFSAHTYHPEKAEQIVVFSRTFLPVLKKLVEKLNAI